MTVELNIPPELEKQLRQQAGDAGEKVEDFVLDAVRDKLAATKRERPAKVLKGKAWRKAFEEWIASHKPLGYIVDDSRESIYGDDR